MIELNKMYQGDALEILKTFPDENINCVMTSPPYWALRDYQIKEDIIWDGDKNCQHEWSEIVGKVQRKESPGVGAKQEINANQGNFCSKCSAWKGQLGLEPTFDLYIKHLCDIFDEVKRILRKDGTCWINLGDTYSGGGSGQKDTGKAVYEEDDFRKSPTKTNLPDKSLCNIPARFSIEMQNRGWILRNVIIWHKRNCMPSSVKDRFTVDFEYLFFFVKNKKYFFETQREPHLQESIERTKHSWNGHREPMSSYIGMDIAKMCHPNGRNKRSVWSITTKGFPEAHFAVYPEELCETPIKAGCPEFVCNKCGVPILKRYSGTIEDGNSFNIRVRDMQVRPEKWGSLYKASEEEKEKYNESDYSNKTTRKVEEIKCNCNAGFSPGIVLDPFFGAGTTGLVALKQNKRFIGIELNPEYIKIANKRLKPHLEQRKLIFQNQIHR